MLSYQHLEKGHSFTTLLTPYLHGEYQWRRVVFFSDGAEKKMGCRYFIASDPIVSTRLVSERVAST